MRKYKIVLLMAFFVYSFTVRADLKVGDVVLFPVCEAFQEMSFEGVDDFYAVTFDVESEMPGPYFVVACKGSQGRGLKEDRYLLKSTYNEKTNEWKHTVKKKFEEPNSKVSDPEPLFIFKYNVNIKDNIIKSEGSVDGQLPAEPYTVLFYAEKATPSCPKNSEIKTLLIMYTPIKGKKAIMSLGAPVNSGICVDTYQYSPPISDMSIIDTDLETEGGSKPVRVLAYFNDMQQSESLLVLEYAPKTGIRLLAKLTDKRLFPEVSGNYFEAGRLLPGTTKIALAYHTPALLTFDYSDGKITELYKVSQDEGVGRAGGGTFPDYDSLRHKLWVPYGTQELFFLTTDENQRPTLLSFQVGAK